MKRALLNIDYTYDFVADDGALTCGKPGQDLEERIMEITKEFYNKGDFIVFPIDIHHQNDSLHPEASLFNPHNLEGTKGRELYGSLEDYYQQIKSSENVYYCNKTRYSAFVGTDIELKLRERDIKEVHLIGVCTDICILHTAIDAYNKGFEIVIHSDGVASFSPSGHEFALSHFKNTLGAKVI